MNENLLKIFSVMIPFIIKLIFDKSSNTNYIHGKSVKRYQSLKMIDYFFLIFITLAALLGQYKIYKYFEFCNENFFISIYIGFLTINLILVFLYLFWNKKKKFENKNSFFYKNFNSEGCIRKGVTIFTLVISIAFSAAIMSLAISIKEINLDNLICSISIISIVFMFASEIILLNMFFSILLGIFSNPENIYVYLENEIDPIKCDNVYLNNIYYVLYKRDRKLEHQYILIPRDKILSISFSLNRIYS